MQGVEYRAARPDEYLYAAQLRGEMALEMGDDFDARVRDWRTKFAQYFFNKHAAGSAELFLALDGGDPVASVLISILDDYRSFVFDMKTAWINGVFVKPLYRRRGIARSLMRMAIDWAREKRCRRVRLRTSDEGRDLYASLGFATGREMELNP